MGLEVDFGIEGQHGDIKGDDHRLGTRGVDAGKSAVSSGLVAHGGHSPHAVVEAMQHATFDQILLNADHFQADIIFLVVAVDRRRSEMLVLAQDDCVGGLNLRTLVPAQDIFLKPFSTQHLVGVLKQRQAQRLFPSAIRA